MEIISLSKYMSSRGQVLILVGNGYIENRELDDFLMEMLTMSLPYTNCVQVKSVVFSILLHFSVQFRNKRVSRVHTKNGLALQFKRGVSRDSDLR
jgi:hypothetical protein